MEDAVAISVIVPVYKGIRFLREALDSLRAQTFSDWECICVDDGSKDGSGALADEIAAEDVRIRVIHQPNGGTSVARNTALKAVRGKYVAFLDEDDAYHPQMLETLHAAIEKTGADVVGCEFARFEETAHPDFSEPVPGESTWTVAEGRGVVDLAADYYAGVPYEIWRNLFRRETIAGHPFPDGVRVEQDHRWIYTLLPRIRKYVRIPWHGYAWRASSIGGYLHPDFASMMSLMKTSRIVLDVVRNELKMDAGQLARFRIGMAKNLEWNILWNLRTGFRLTRAQSCELRRALKSFYADGVDIRLVLHGKKRVLWTLFMLTGSTWWIRK